MGIAQSVVEEAIVTWEPHNAWCDNRMFIMLAAEAQVVCVVHNTVDGSLSLFCPEGTYKPDATIWAFRQTEQHCDPYRIVDLPRLYAVLGQMTLRPWTGALANQHFQTKGADCLYPSRPRYRLLRKTRVSSSGLDEKSGKPHGTGTYLPPERSIVPDVRLHVDASDLDGVAPIVLSTWNIGGWGTRHLEVRGMLANLPFGVLALQETGLTAQGQKSAANLLRDLKYRLVCGEATPLTRTSRGHVRSCKGDVPGVAFAHHESLALAHVQPKTDKAKLLQKRGRLIVAILHVPCGQHNACVLMNAYCPSGFAKEAERDEMMTLLMEEAMSYGHVPVAILGDFQQFLPESMLGALVMHGWQIPPIVDADQFQDNTTY
eukprot:5336073-Amphidinium_carterae.1